MEGEERLRKVPGRGTGSRARRATGLALVSVLCVGAWVAPVSAQDHQGHTHAMDREIKALSVQEQAEYLAGEGMGFALAAELNGYPGPRHVLDAAEGLGLDEGQREAITEVFRRMRAEAIRLGEEVVEAEGELDRLFAEGAATAEAVRALSVRIGELDGELRSVHLLAHLETTALLDEGQIQRYKHLRGYHRPEGHPHP
jgi:hypothetical protein